MGFSHFAWSVEEYKKDRILFMTSQSCFVNNLTTNASETCSSWHDLSRRNIVWSVVESNRVGAILDFAAKASDAKQLLTGHVQRDRNARIDWRGRICGERDAETWSEAR